VGLITWALVTFMGVPPGFQGRILHLGCRQFRKGRHQTQRVGQIRAGAGAAGQAQRQNEPGNYFGFWGKAILRQNLSGGL